MTSTHISPTTLADVPALQEIAEQTGLFPKELLPDMLAPALATQTDAFWLTCRTGGVPIGFCYVRPEELADGCWNMLALGVRPGHQRKSCGSSLVQAAEQQLQAAKQRLLIVETSGTDDFALTRRFYLKLGYQQEARIRDFWAKGDDKVIFAKALD